MSLTLDLRQDRLVTPPSPRVRRAKTAMPYRPAAVAGARAWLRKTLADWGIVGDASDNAELLLSEIYTNAIIHNRIATGAVAGIHAAFWDGQLRVTVSDPDRLAPGPGLPVDEHGRGLEIVTALADRWGTETTPTGKITYFELAVGGPR